MKSYILHLLLFLSVTSSLAQLTVRNDAYIFVDGSGFDDTVTDTAPLFVTDDINIQDTNSHIYLRNDAQLIQGEPAVPTGNAGIGKLSVYQDGTVNEFTYNYWCSPVGNVQVDDNANRAFIPNEQFYDFIGDPDPMLNPITSNLAGYATTAYNGTSSPLNIESYWLWKFDPGITYNDWDFVGQSGTVNSGYGFTMKGTIGSTPSAGQLYDFRGKPNNGNIDVAIEDGLQTLIGNPYPSALDSYLFIHDTDNAGLEEVSNPGGFDGALYYWEQNLTTSHLLTTYVGGYATYTNYQVSDNGTPADLTDDTVMDSFTLAPFSLYDANGNPLFFPGNGIKTAYRYIPIGQGFMVTGTAGIPALTTLKLKNAHRAFYKETGADSYFFRTNQQAQANTNTQQYDSNGQNIVPAGFKRFRLNVGFDNIEAYSRQLLMNFHSSATDGFDFGLEAKGKGILDTDAHWTLNGNPYVIQAFPFAVDLAIPVVVIAEQQQPVFFKIGDVQNFDDNQSIYLHDIDTNIFVDLRAQDFYSMNLPQGVYTDRFEIVFQDPNSLNNDEFTDSGFVIFQDNNANQLVIVNPNTIPLKSVTIYDITGKRVFNKLNLENETRLTFSTKNLSDGVYVVKTETRKNTTINKKVVIKN